jgi:sterol desaturase/sphingolipid hydroxylase (fatty acid hydroxylase superfamily)
MVVIDSLIVRIVFPAAAVGAALFAATHGLGLFNVMAAPPLLTGIIAFALLDLLIYAQHVIFHRVPALWRVHSVHHSDIDVDVTTALRFHPVEIVASMLVKAAAVVLLGAPPLAVLLFETVLNGMAIFNHANLKIPDRIERILRLFLVTPDMHRVHHSWEMPETNSNFGFNLSIWDRLFRTYRAQPRAGQTGMTLGLAGLQDETPTRLGYALALPFRGLGGALRRPRRSQKSPTGK